MDKQAIVSKLRYWTGYILFFGLLGYAIRNAPQTLWEITPIWLALTVLVILVLFAFQVLQFQIFLSYHSIKPDWMWIAWFTTKKGILNTIFPAKSGTLFLLHTLTKRHPVRWHDYLRFMFMASFTSLWVSALALAGMVLEVTYFSVLFSMSVLAVFVAARYRSFLYLGCLPYVFLVACGFFLVFIVAFWFLLNGMGISIAVLDSAYFAIAVNAMAQISVTPGNVGFREMVLGAIAPYISLPKSVGIIAGAIFYVLRVAVYGVIWLWLEWALKDGLVVTSVPKGVNQRIKR
jgi:hypothetical protein